ncbi:unnamed protein product [Choristocarpus tenellus]
MFQNVGELGLLAVLVLQHLRYLSAVICPTTSEPLRVVDTPGAKKLSAAVNCTGGTVDAVWVGLVIIDGTIEVGQGTVLNIVGEVGDGGTDAVVQGASSARIFEVRTGATLQVKNATIRGGLADAAGGGGIRCSGASLILEDCVLESNESNGSGGGIWMEESTIVVTGGSFVGNTAEEGVGGAVHAIKSNITMDGVQLGGNRALEGGAIHVVGANFESQGGTVCSIRGSTLNGNIATVPLNVYPDPDLLPAYVSMPGGGGVYVGNATLDVTDCALIYNVANSSGGALNSNSGAVTVMGSELRGNRALVDGGAVLVKDALFDGNTTMIENNAGNDGGGIFQRPGDGTMVIGDVLFTNNEGKKGGAVFGYGVVEVFEGTIMNGTNIAHDKGGCIYSKGGSNFSIYGGTFTGCHAEENGGFLFASAKSVVIMYDGTVDSCLAERRAGAMYASGDDEGGLGASVTVRGGTFVNNTSLELGGGFVAWGATTMIVFAGGQITNSSTRFFGGFLFLEEQASVNCTNTVVEGSLSGDQGGGLYARDATFIYWACDLIANDAPQGADMYLTQVREVNMVDSRIDHLSTTRSSNAVDITGSHVVANGVKLAGSVASGTDIAVQMDASSSFLAMDCVFNGWQGDSILQNDGGELVLEGCDFSGSAAKAAVSSVSTAVIRNAVVGDQTFEMATNNMALVDNALTCSDSQSCSPGVCLDGELGVYCQCYASLVTGKEVCMDGGGNITMWVSKAPDVVTYWPAMVEFTLAVHAQGGSEPVLWNISTSSSDFNISLYPSSGMLPPGSSVSVRVEALPGLEMGGNLTTSFTAEGFAPRTTASVDVLATYFLCRAFEYADFRVQSVTDLPGIPSSEPEGEFETEEENEVECTQCAEIEGADGVDCSTPGATLKGLPLKDGYWRATTQSLVVRECVNSDSCVGGTLVVDSDEYCASGYLGPCECIV